LTEAEERTWEHLREEVSRRIMEAEFPSLFKVKPPAYPEPDKARILASLTCASRGEPVMETRTRRFREQCLCIPCFESAENR